MKKAPPAFHRGFTLVELAIVLIIVGLIIAGVLRGEQMIQNARIAKTVGEIEGYRAAVLTFHDKYDGYPGDMRNATVRVPDCGFSTFCTDGNGNAHVGNDVAPPFQLMTLDQSQGGANQEGETVQFWRHLLLADLIQSVGVADQNNPAEIAWGKTHPASSLGLGGYHIHYAPRILASPPAVPGIPTRPVSGHYFRLQNPVTGQPIGATNNNVVSERVALAIDEKLDDGDPAEGHVLSGGPACRFLAPVSGGCGVNLEENTCSMWFHAGF